MTRVERAAAELTAALPLGEDLIAEPDADSPAMVRGGGSPVHSSPAWNTAAAWAVTDAHAGIRSLERGLQLRLTGTARPRGGSDANTVAAIAAIVRHAAALQSEHDTPAEGRSRGCHCDTCRIVRLLERWTTAFLVLAAVDQAARWVPIRQRDGELILCPYCSTPSLRAAFARHLVACGNPACCDSDGNSPLARIERSRVTSEYVFAWSDGLVT